MSAPDYEALKRRLAEIVPEGRLIDDPLRLLAYATDASFYRLVPKLAVVVATEAEVVAVIAACRSEEAPMTFRAAGTSLSGQAVTDSVLVMLGDGWRRCEVSEDAATIRLGPGVIGAEANRALAPFNRKIGPDPASINAAKIGGIAANNASGMCCGTAENSYQTLAGLRVVLADGTALDTRDPVNRQTFAQTHALLLQGLSDLSREVRADPELSERIRKKFKLKNTTGYSLNALIDYVDPFDILEHLMVGSEGTLGFLSEITYRTVPEHPHKASALIFFDTVAAACDAVSALKPAPVSAVELIDRRGLRSVEGKPDLPPELPGLGPEATALLVEVRAETPEVLAERIAAVTSTLAAHTTVSGIVFTDDPAEYGRYWAVRKGLFPSLGVLRAKGTTVIIEDVAFPVPRLAAATTELQTLFGKHGYDDAIIFGHALEGNLHFVFAQDFSTPAEVARYGGFMDDVCRLVVEGYDGSLKAEHGTGRNMAPYVELEWGPAATRLMHRIKALFDPEGLLNPGVILNADPRAHVSNLKPMPAASDIVDTCIECGFCEPVCPSVHMTLTPRQRIVGWREISRLAADGLDPAREKSLRDLYAYHGLETCAACGLCGTVCPMGIETGSLTKLLRGQNAGPLARTVGKAAAAGYGPAMAATRAGLAAAGMLQSLFGDDTVDRIGAGLRKASGNRLPQWTHSFPGPGRRLKALPPHRDGRPKVVYFPSCAARSMGPARGDPERRPLPKVVQVLLDRAGYDTVMPRGLAGLCCGQPWESKGHAETAAGKAEDLEEALYRASDNGTLPVLFDTSPCTYRMKAQASERLRVRDIAEFLHDDVLPRLTVTSRVSCVAVHHTCSARKGGLTGKLDTLAAACADAVVVPPDVTCCGFAGDRGFTTPELNEHALRHLKSALPADCAEGVSTSRTCEIGTSHHGGIPYRSIAYLLERCTRPQ